MIRFCPLFSGSSGNSVYIGDNNTGLLVDVGRSAKQTTLILEKFGIDPCSIKGILLTHEHIDHVNGLRVFSKKYNIPVYASPATLLALKSKGSLTPEIIDIAISDAPFEIEGLTVNPFKTSHDCADGRGYVITGTDGTTKVGIATDTGIVSSNIMDKLTGCNIVYLESNHDIKMLRTGPYSYDLQKRILSDKGHLSNDTCAEVLTALINKGSTHFVLAHLSKENNTPQLAYQTSVNALMGACALENRDYIIRVAQPENTDKPIIL